MTIPTDLEDTAPRTLDSAGLPEYHGTLGTPRPTDLNLGPLTEIPPTEDLADALAREQQATQAYEEAGQSLRDARRALDAAKGDHEQAIRHATRNGDKTPAPPKLDKLEQQHADARVVLDERARLVSAARTEVAALARRDYPALRESAVDRLDQAQHLVDEALGKLRAALGHRTRARGAVAGLDATYGEQYARTEGGMVRPVAKDGSPITVQADNLRRANSQRQALAEHALRLIGRELEFDASLRQAIADHAPAEFYDAAPASVPAG